MVGFSLKMDENEYLRLKAFKAFKACRAIVDAAIKNRQDRNSLPLKTLFLESLQAL